MKIGLKCTAIYGCCRAFSFTGAVWQILYIGSEALDDRIIVSLPRQAFIDLIGELLHDQPELVVGQDEVLAGISYLQTEKRMMRLVIDLRGGVIR